MVRLVIHRDRRVHYVDLVCGKYCETEIPGEIELLEFPGVVILERTGPARGFPPSGLPGATKGTLFSPVPRPSLDCGPDVGVTTP